MKETSYDGLKGRDKIVGRPIRLNQKVLELKPGKPYAEVVFMGCVHIGSPQHDSERFLKQVDYCVENGIYVLLMGDIVEFATRYSIGAGVYEQSMIGQSQIEYAVEVLSPLAEKGLLLGFIAGNHEFRAYQAVGIDVAKVMANALDTTFLGYGCWNLFRVGNQKYRVYALHGSSGAKFVYTKLKAVVDISHGFDCDVLAMAHVHELASDFQLVQHVDMRHATVRERKKLVLLCGSYLFYEGYAQMKGLPPVKLGSPKVQFYGDRFDIHVSF